jgi:hypothetical protein
MTKRELIEALEALECGDDTKIVRAETDGGLSTVRGISQANIVFDYRNNVPYIGNHEYADYLEEDTVRSFGKTFAIVIG